MATDFGKRLRTAREHAGLTQPELAAKVPMAQSTLAAAETSGDGSRLTAQIAHVCRVSSYWLATGEGDMLAGVTVKESLTVQPPTLAQALEVMGIELAREMPDDVRQDVADTLAKLANRKGAARHQRELLTLLAPPPASVWPAKKTG